MDERTRKQNTGFALLFGMAAGAAIGWWLNSDNGRVFRRSTADAINDYTTQVSQKAAEGVETAKTKVNEVVEHSKEVATHAIDQGKTYAAHASEALKAKAATYAESATNVVDHAGDALKAGAEKAREQLKKSEMDIENTIKNGKA